MFGTVPAATNHQGIVDQPEQARATRTIERERCILDLLGRPATTAASFEDASLRSPLFSTAYDSGFGTLYTAAYRPSGGIRGPPMAVVLVATGSDPFVEAEHTEVLAEGAVA